MDIIFAVVVVAGMIIHLTPPYQDRGACVKDTQEIGYSAIKGQVEEKEKSTVKIYCINPKKDYPNMEKLQSSNLKDADLVSERNVEKEFK